jgi:hypothetical protein
MKCKLSEISHCAFGNETVEDIEHLFLDCHYTNYIQIYMLPCLRGNFNKEIKQLPLSLVV